MYIYSFEKLEVWKEAKDFTTISFGSAVELLNQLILALELGFMSMKDYKDLRSHLESITNKLNALRNHQQK